MKDIDAAELKPRLESEKDLIVIDVREEWEYDEKNIGVKNIPLGSLPSRLSEISQYKDQELVVHCKSGGRSAQAQKYLRSQGFTQVRNLIGGIEGYLS